MGEARPPRSHRDLDIGVRRGIASPFPTDLPAMERSASAPVSGAAVEPPEEGSMAKPGGGDRDRRNRERHVFGRMTPNP